MALRRKLLLMYMARNPVQQAEARICVNLPSQSDNNVCVDPAQASLGRSKDVACPAQRPRPGAHLARRERRWTLTECSGASVSCVCVSTHQPSKQSAAKQPDGAVFPLCCCRRERLPLNLEACSRGCLAILDGPALVSSPLPTPAKSVSVFGWVC